jgi:hypothetical protein
MPKSNRPSVTPRTTFLRLAISICQRAEDSAASGPMSVPYLLAISMKSSSSPPESASMSLPPDLPNSSVAVAASSVRSEMSSSLSTVSRNTSLASRSEPSELATSIPR